MSSELLVNECLRGPLLGFTLPNCFQLSITFLFRSSLNSSQVDLNHKYGEVLSTNKEITVYCTQQVWVKDGLLREQSNEIAALRYVN